AKTNGAPCSSASSRSCSRRTWPSFPCPPGQPLMPCPWLASHAHGAASIAMSWRISTLPKAAPQRLIPAEQNSLLYPAVIASWSRLPWRKRCGARYAPQPDAVSITQATEYGTVYTLDEIAAIGESARNAGIQFHIDGARFANSLVTLGCTPA